MYEDLIKDLRDPKCGDGTQYTKIHMRREAADAIENLLKIIQRQKDSINCLAYDMSFTQRWIPVTERLPETNGEYLVKVGAPHKPIRIYEYKPTDLGDRNENLWIGNGGYCFNWFVEYWMPLPSVEGLNETQL